MSNHWIVEMGNKQATVWGYLVQVYHGIYKQECGLCRLCLKVSTSIYGHLTCAHSSRVPPNWSCCLGSTDWSPRSTSRRWQIFAIVDFSVNGYRLSPQPACHWFVMHLNLHVCRNLEFLPFLSIYWLRPAWAILSNFKAEHEMSLTTSIQGLGTANVIIRRYYSMRYVMVNSF